jgi:hypothetical protein
VGGFESRRSAVPRILLAEGRRLVLPPLRTRSELDNVDRSGPAVVCCRGPPSCHPSDWSQVVPDIRFFGWGAVTKWCREKEDGIASNLASNLP